MSAPFSWPFPTAAVAAVAIAVWAGPNYAITIPATAVAVGAAGATVVEAIVRRTDRPPLSLPRPEERPFGVRELFRVGTRGRPDIVALIDRIDRAGDHPDLLLRTDAEIRRLLALSDEEFLRYVRYRLDSIEGVS